MILKRIFSAIFLATISLAPVWDDLAARNKVCERILRCGIYIENETKKESHSEQI